MTINRFMTYAVTGSLALGCSSIAFAATIVTAGSDIDVATTAGPPYTTDYWRTTSVSKPNDIDGDNVLGTDGYRYLRDGSGIQSSAPSYASFSLTTANFDGNVNYAAIDDGSLTPGASVANLRSGTFNPQPSPRGEGTWVSFGTFSFNRNALPGEVVRVGLMVDNLDNTVFNSGSLRLSTGGVNTDVTIFTTTGAGAHRGNRNPDWYYWDVTNFTSGESVEISATSSFGNGTNSTPATIGAFSFDSIPEPSSAILIGLGGLSLLSRRRR